MEDNKIYGPFEVDQRIKVHSNYYAGKMGSTFYSTLRDEKRILGIKCEKCDKVYWPPRETCVRCFSLLTHDDMTEIGPQGTLESYTIVTVSSNWTVRIRQWPIFSEMWSSTSLQSACGWKRSSPKNGTRIFMISNTSSRLNS